MTTGKTIALTRATFVDKVMSLLLNVLSRLVITFLPRSNRLLISWLQSPSAVILEPRKIKSGTVSTVSPSTCHEVMGPDAMILVFWKLSFKPAFSLSSFTLIEKFFWILQARILEWVAFPPPEDPPNPEIRPILSIHPSKKLRLCPSLGCCEGCCSDWECSISWMIISFHLNICPEMELLDYRTFYF